MPFQDFVTHPKVNPLLVHYRKCPNERPGRLLNVPVLKSRLLDRGAHFKYSESGKRFVSVTEIPHSGFLDYQKNKTKQKKPSTFPFRD